MGPTGLHTDGFLPHMLCKVLQVSALSFQGPQAFTQGNTKLIGHYVEIQLAFKGEIIRLCTLWQ